LGYSIVGILISMVPALLISAVITGLALLLAVLTGVVPAPA
jgi:hypothetical protein